VSVEEAARHAAPIDTAPLSKPGRRLSLEVALEIALIGLCGALFVYMLAESFRVHPDVGRLPRIASGFGLVMLVLYLGHRVWTWGRQLERGQIMDLGFDEAGLARSTIVTRTLRVVLSTAALFAGALVFGFHITVPLYVFGYLYFWGRLPWYWALVAAVGFEAYIVFAYDIAIRAHWPEPIVKLLPATS
jgi:hypothetical protein